MHPRTVRSYKKAVRICTWLCRSECIGKYDIDSHPHRTLLLPNRHHCGMRIAHRTLCVRTVNAIEYGMEDRRAHWTHIPHEMRTAKTDREKKEPLWKVIQLKTNCVHHRLAFSSQFQPVKVGEGLTAFAHHHRNGRKETMRMHFVVFQIAEQNILRSVSEQCIWRQQHNNAVPVGRMSVTRGVCNVCSRERGGKKENEREFHHFRVFHAVHWTIIIRNDSLRNYYVSIREINDKLISTNSRWWRGEWRR